MLLRTLVLTGLLGLAVSARAADRTTTLAGSSLAIDTPCATHVDIVADPGLHAQVSVSATASHQEELDRLVVEMRDGVVVHTARPGCWRPIFDLAFQRTLQLSIRVPAGMPLSIDEGGAGRYTIGAIGGPLKLSLSGSAQVDAARASRLDIDLSGNGGIRLAEIAGPATVGISGHGDIVIGRAAISTLMVDISGNGSLTVNGGKIGSADIDESGLGSVRVEATVGDARVDLSGAGSAHFAEVTGGLHKSVSGLGSMTVGR